MEQATLERQLVRCRYLVTRGAVHRLGLPDIEAIKLHEDSFIREVHSVLKKAQQIFTETLLSLEAEIDRLSSEDKTSRSLKKHQYWLRIFESSYESFLWMRFSGSDIIEIYKGPKHGSLSTQNPESALKAAESENRDPYVFAIPLDFTRFSCVVDLLILRRHPGQNATEFVELKEGAVNEAMAVAIRSRNPDRAFEFFEKYGEKGVKQAERFNRQVNLAMERDKLIGARSGVFKRGAGVRMVVDAKEKPEYFTGEINGLCDKARQGDYAADIVDSCLMVAAADATSRKKYALADFDARLLVLNAFVAEEDTAKYSPERLVSELERIELTEWTEGLGSIFFIPPLLRQLSTHSFLDLLFARVRLFCYLDAPGFIQLARKIGLKAGFIRKKVTNKLKTLQRWGAGDYPIFEGRALGYMAGNHPIVMGSLRLHQMFFNWQRPASVITEIVNSVPELMKQDVGSPDFGEFCFTEDDLEY